MTKIKIIIACAFLAGCSAGINPTWPDLGPEPVADGATTDAPDSGQALDPDLGPDAFLEPDGGAPDAGGDPDLGTDPDLGPAPDLGPPACVAVDTRTCADGACCNAACRPDGTCPPDHSVSLYFCTCEGAVDCGASTMRCSFNGMECACR